MPAFVQRSFAGGEIPVTLAARVDQPKARFGLRVIRNFLVSRSGALVNRNGSKYITTTKGNAAARLIQFIFNDADSYHIEMGDLYFRFIRSGAQVTVAGPAAYSPTAYYTPGDIVSLGAAGAYAHWYCKAAVSGVSPIAGDYWYALTMTNLTDTPTVGGISILEVPHPYAAADLFNVRFVQSGDVITFMHATYPVHELTRFGATDWTMLTIGFAPPIRAPAGVQATRNGTGNQKYRYKVTAIKKEGYQESLSGYAGKQAGATIDNTGTGGDLQLTFASDPIAGVGTRIVIVDAYPTTGTRDEAFDALVIGKVFTVSLDAGATLDLQIPNAAGGDDTSAGIVAPAGYAVYAVIGEDTAGAAALSGFDFNSPVISGGGTKPITLSDTGHGFVTGDVIFILAVVGANSSAPTNKILAAELSGKTWAITVVDVNSYTLDGSEGISGTVTSHSALRFPTWVEITGCAVPAKAVSLDGVDQKQHVVRCAPVSDAGEYWVYKEKNGVYGYIGTMTQSSALGQYELRDEGQEPDTTKVPPVYRNPFLKADSYPQAGGYVHQRLCLGGTNDKPQGTLMSRTGDFHNFTTRSPLEDDDSVEFTVAGQRAYRIRHLLDLDTLVILTAGNEIVARGDADGVIRPTAINLSVVGYVGASNVSPLLVSGAAIFAQARGGQVFDLRRTADGLVPRDLTAWSPHLVDGYTIIDWCWAQSPHSALFAVRSDGKVIGMTYMPDQDVYAWWRLDTLDNAGTGFEVIEAISCAPESNEDVVCWIAKRTVNGSTVRYIERLAERRAGLFTSTNSVYATFLDSYVAYTAAANGTATPAVAHLEGRTVYGLRDGVKIGPLTVTAGVVTVTANWSTLVLGIQIQADIQTHAADADSPRDPITGTYVAVPSIEMIVEQSRGMYAGYDFDHVVQQYQMPATNATATALHTGVADMNILGGWRAGEGICIRHSDPVPCTILALALNLKIGGKPSGASR